MPWHPQHAQCTQTVPAQGAAVDASAPWTRATAIGSAVRTDRLPELLAAYRNAQGLSMQAAAGRLGVGRTVWRTWEKQSVVPGPENLDALAKLLGLPVAAMRTAAGPDRVRNGHHCACGSAHGLAGLRARAGLTSRELASRVLASPSTLTRWESGERPCGHADRERLASALGMSREDIEQALGPLPAIAAVPVPGLLRARAAAGLSQRAVAQRVGVDAATLRRWERRGSAPAAAVDVLLECVGPDVFRQPPQPERTRPAAASQSPLRKLRRRAGLSDKVTAARAGVAVSTLYAWERDARRPGWASLRRLSRVYGVPFAEVFTAVGQHGPRHFRLGPWPDESLPAVLPDVRHWYGLTQAQFGELVGVGAGTVAGWERGRQRPGRPARAALDRLAAGDCVP